MKTADFIYDLPQELIAQYPADERDHSRLLVLDRNTSTREDKLFSDVTDYFEPGDCLVINNTRVVPARVFGTYQSGKSQVQIFFLKHTDDGLWEVLAYPGKKARPGKQIFLNDELTAEVVSFYEDGRRLVKINADEQTVRSFIEQSGHMPLPPYIARKDEPSDRERYQTVYAAHDGSVAAPTAGLHFTDEILGQLEAKGVRIARLTLHVGIGTFKPVEAEDVVDHKVDEEFYQLDQATADVINQTKKDGGKVWAVGTTSTRTLESAGRSGQVEPGSGWTGLFIYPGFEFKIVDRLITNFHLPKSSLLMLVAAFAGQELVMETYREAVEKKYRFYSYGDAMLVK